MRDLKQIFIKLLAAAAVIAALTLCITVCAHASEKSEITVGDSTLPVHVLQKPRNDDESFVILFLGDGYTAAEQDEFLKDLKPCVEQLLKTEPFRSCSDRINIYAVPTVSNESGASNWGYTEKDTYYKVTQIGKGGNIRSDGQQRAKAIRDAMESGFLDGKASIGTIQILSNSWEYFGGSDVKFFSFVSKGAIADNLVGSIHELAHSIGKLQDEYAATDSDVNISKDGDSSTVPWKKLVGFRGVGVVLNDNLYRIPTMNCIMRTLDNIDLCEVCKMALVTRMNMRMYTPKPRDQYVAEPDITLANHGSVTGAEYDKCRIHNGNITNANGKSIELRTIVQNFMPKERHVKLQLSITDKNGNLKYSKEESFTIAPLLNEYNSDAARESLSLTLDDVTGLVIGDKLTGKLTDADNQTVLAEYLGKQAAFGRINIHHRLKDAKGNITDMPNTGTTTVYAPVGTAYRLSAPQKLGGGRYVSNSIGSNTVSVTANATDIEYYYIIPASTPLTSTRIDDDGKSITIDAPSAPSGAVAVLALYRGDTMTEIKAFTVGSGELTYTAKDDFTHVKVMLWQDLNSLCPMGGAELVAP